MTKEKRKTLRQIAWFNLFIGIYNLYLFSIGGDWIFNFLIGSLNIGVWVFFRDVSLLTLLIKNNKSIKK